MIIALKNLLEKMSQQEILMRGWGKSQFYQRQLRSTHCPGVWGCHGLSSCLFRLV